MTYKGGKRWKIRIRYLADDHLGYQIRLARTGSLARPEYKTPGHHSCEPFGQNRATVQTYLRYQSTKFFDRFDTNCYLAVTEKLDNHDILRGCTDRGVLETPVDRSFRLY